jgi:hypothetical protein
MRPGYHTQQVETKDVGTGVGTALGGIGVRASPVVGTAGALVGGGCFLSPKISSEIDRKTSSGLGIYAILPGPASAQLTLPAEYRIPVSAQKMDA